MFDLNGKFKDILYILKGILDKVLVEDERASCLTTLYLVSNSYFDNV